MKLITEKGCILACGAPPPTLLTESVPSVTDVEDRLYIFRKPRDNAAPVGSRSFALRLEALNSWLCAGNFATSKQPIQRQSFHQVVEALGRGRFLLP